MSMKRACTACSLTILAAASAFLPSAALASEQNETFKGVIACRDVEDDRARLACFDKAVKRMGDAEAAGEIRVVDRAQVRATRRQIFGLNLPRLPVFDSKNEEEIESIEAVAKSARRLPNGAWSIILEDGAVWQQTDSKPLARSPRAGSKIEIRRGAMGSYFLRVDSQPGIKVRRES